MNKQTIKKINESWSPKIKDKLVAQGHDVRAISESRLEKVAKLCHTRKIFESSATTTNVPGRGDFNLGNNTQTGLGGPGSGEVFQNLFGVFVEVASTNTGMDLLPMLPMSKSNLTVHVAEPIYTDGIIDSADEKPQVFQVKTDITGSVPLTVGTSYTVKTAAAAGEDIIDLVYVGEHRLKANVSIFKPGSVYDNSGGGGTNWTTEKLSTLLDSGTNGAGIYVDGSNYVGFDGGIDYVEGFTNVIQGYGGSGKDDTNPWFTNRQNGTNGSSPMNRKTGERAGYRSMGMRTWHKNFSAETFNVDLELTTEQYQDLAMDHDIDAMEFTDDILKDQLDQYINDHILTMMFAFGWQHHFNMNQQSGFNMNAFIDSASSTGADQTFIGQDGTNKTIGGAAGVLPSSGAISENLSSLQRRIITRLMYGAGVIKSRSRRGRGNQAVMNTTFASSLNDIRGFQPAPFPNDLQQEEETGLAYIGSLYNMKIYEDGAMALDDERINISRKGGDKDPGLKFCPYILGEKISTIAEGTMAPKVALKSRYSIAEAGSYPELNYLTFTVEQGAGYKLV
jgi:hypothetical protein